MNSLVELQNITVEFSGRKILDNINLTVNKGEITTVIGPNGAGKSTLIKVILGLQRKLSGQVIKQNKLKVGYVPQKLHLNHTLPLNVAHFLKLAGHYSTQEKMSALELVGASHLINQDVHKLSGGETQRVLIARALLQRPELLVLDEPAQGVDIQGQIDLYDLIDTLRHRFSCAVFMVSHDLHLVMAKTDNVICLHHHICCSGSPESVTANPSYIEMFGETQNASLAIYPHRHNHHHHDLAGAAVAGDAHQCTDHKHGHTHD
jgi:zinc transport system ATP-binding protein